MLFIHISLIYKLIVDKKLVYLSLLFCKCCASAPVANEIIPKAAKRYALDLVVSNIFSPTGTTTTKSNKRNIPKIMLPI